MHKLITHCISEDYQTVTDIHDDNDRGEVDLPVLNDALISASYTMPHSSAMGVVIAGDLRPTFFYTSDYQGSFSLEPTDRGVFDADDIINLVLGRTTIKEVRDNKVLSDKNMSRWIYIVLGCILLAVLYFTAAPFFGW